MDGNKRRQAIVDILKKSLQPVSGTLYDNRRIHSRRRTARAGGDERVSDRSALEPCRTGGFAVRPAAGRGRPPTPTRLTSDSCTPYLCSRGSTALPERPPEASAPKHTARKELVCYADIFSNAADVARRRRHDLRLRRNGDARPAGRMLCRRASCGGGRAEPLIRKNNRAPTRRAARERNADSV